MPAKEIKELRKVGKLEEALQMATTELQAEPENIWAKRNISWVYYDHLKQNSSHEHFGSFINWLIAIKDLQLPNDETMLLDQVCWQTGKLVFSLLKPELIDHQKIIVLFETIQPIHFPKPSEGYSFLFKAFHKALKNTDRYVEFADWWGFENFEPKDFEKEKLPDGKDLMAIAEQAYISYAKHLLPKQTQNGEVLFDRERALAFLPKLSEVVNNYSQFQYPAYFNAKLLLALGTNDNILELLLPFAKKKRNDFWVWEILAEAFPDDPDKVFACYCKALSCNSPEEMLVSLRQKMAELLIARQLYNEARTEIGLAIDVRNVKGWRIPGEVISWQEQEWYKKAKSQKSNLHFYKQFVPLAESILFSDIPEEAVIVEFINSDKQILNFIASESKFGFFKYDRFLKKVSIGDILKIRIQKGTNGGLYQVYTAVKSDDKLLRDKFLKQVEGEIKIQQGKAFGFLDDVYIHPSLISKLRLKDKDHFEGKALKSYNGDKKQWTWKLVEME
jgi:hypothetical protein